MQNHLSRKVMISCFLAACLELYDFAIFGFFTPLLHKNYLSFLNEGAAQIIAYALFAVGFLFRPLGSIIFGYIGDIYGRKRALVLSVTLMGTASLGMFLLPTYAMIGMISCYIIAAIRIVQGISVGGEYSGAIIYAIEHLNKKNAGIVGGIIISGCMCGSLLAILVTNLLKMPFLPSYSWRFAFLIGFGLAIVGYFIRKNLVETPEFKKMTLNKKKIPLIEGIKKYPIECICAILIAAANGINFYFILVFLPEYINKLTNLNINFYSVITISILIVISPIFGYFSDSYGRARMIRYGLITISCFSLVGLQLLAIYPSFFLAILFFCGHALIFSTLAATVNIFIIEIFPPEYRFSCASLSYSLGLGIVGGTSPLFASWVVNNFSNHTLYLSYYMAGISLLGYAGMLLLQIKSRALAPKVNRG